MPRLRLGLAQCNPVVGDLDGNVTRVLSIAAEARRLGCDLVAFPELVLTGYPPEDLLLRPAFVADAAAALDRVAAASSDTVLIVGAVLDSGTSTDPSAFSEQSATSARSGLHNAAAVCADGRVMGTYAKRRLPNYSVFDEQRYFVAGTGDPSLFAIGGVRVGISVCEDLWSADGPVDGLARGGADLVVNINASPFNVGKHRDRVGVLAERARSAGVPIVYVNQVGGQDELVFDGDSMVVGADGEVLARAAQFVEGLTIVDLEIGRTDTPTALPLVDVRSAAFDHDDAADAVVAPDLSEEAEVWHALVTGTRDFVRKNGFTDVVIGLSGGVDSALVAAIAVDALGAQHVHGVLMPSRYSSDHSISDAVELAAGLGIEHRTVPIEPAHAAVMGMLEPSYSGRAIGLAEENLQSRIRAVILMGLSNAFGWLLLNTGNKSESSVGYSTLYGDSAGGYAVIKDVSKLLVYRLCRWRNDTAGRPVIPVNVLDKPPSAELRPDQRDDQSLPPYEELDPILALYVEGDRSPAEIIAAGHDASVVARIVGLVDLAEYKRRQAPPGPRITEKGFGKDRRLPIVNRYRSGS